MQLLLLLQQKTKCPNNPRTAGRMFVLRHCRTLMKSKTKVTVRRRKRRRRTEVL